MAVPLFAFINGTSDVILGIVAAVLIGYSLVVALVLPRRWPDFPRRRLPLFALVSASLVAGMLVSVEVLGEAHHFPSAEAATSSTGAATTTVSSTSARTTSAATTTGGATTSATSTAIQGNAAAGKAVFTSAGCTACHTLKEAGATGTIGPNLDMGLKGKSPDFIRQSIVDPNAEITPGYPPNVMPQDFGQKLSPSDLDNLVAFLVASTKGG